MRQHSRKERTLHGELDLTLQSPIQEDRSSLEQAPRTAEAQTPPSIPPIDQPPIPSHPEIKNVIVEPMPPSEPDQYPIDGTMIIDLSKVDLTKPSTPPPLLVVNESGQSPRIISLTTDRLRIGRAEDNDVVLHNTFISPYHAELEKHSDGYYLVPLPDMTNALFMDGAPVMASPLTSWVEIRTVAGCQRDGQPDYYRRRRMPRVSTQDQF
jgi:hypothetical protein